MHIKKIGQGPDLVMLHGWSMHSAVWHTLADKLAQHFTLYLVDLPGHGKSEWHEGDLDLNVLITNLANELPEKAYWLGWSLGGLICLAFAERFPPRVNKLVLLAATPRFVQANHWSCAMNAEIFNIFSDNLIEDQAGTLQRFLLLQARGSKHSRDTIRQLAEQLAIEQPPTTSVLQAGLKLLIETDMRTQLANLQCPVKMILGDRDTLIPQDMLSAASQLQPKLQTSLLVGAGHAPFISQPDDCFHEIESFLHE